MRAILNRCRHRCRCGDRCIKQRFHGLRDDPKHEYSKRGIHYAVVRENLLAAARASGRIHD